MRQKSETRQTGAAKAIKDIRRKQYSAEEKIRTVLDGLRGEETGGLRVNLILGEDTYAGAKLILAGYALAHSTEAKIYHSHSHTIWEDFKRHFDIGAFHKYENWVLAPLGKP